ncbi:pyridoxine/pyridoxamine 5'-phosphate oxidase [Aquimarina sp. 2201CG14-23]|uniref:pyridoxine/pyridoxamine 5'-phosphate oxidase n=1 Tax=Aquimarina mycalae TaxID=3040073 RepID=UPI002477EB57|nr:pyridoxal 5'-phosphate synthase [Aquimarina sp. 2201CG14-23]MDH7446990.1 pyridoxal 5'-phosphate synthase [Aquimarina sp. 2201CG14-23]
MNIDPFQLFNDWYAEELKQSKVRIPSACCISSIGLDGYPNARFVSLKEVKNNTFIITGPSKSRKGLEIEQSSKVSLTFWWETTEKQIRIQGDAIKISDTEAIRYFDQRGKDSKIISIISEQGAPIKNIDVLKQKYIETEIIYKNKDIAKPENWSGYAIQPIRIECMEFEKSRFHKRTLFQLEGKDWITSTLQP